MAPVKVIIGEAAFKQTLVVPEMAAVGRALTVTVATPVCGWEHAAVLASCTLTKL